jgi:hypothetical protein
VVLKQSRNVQILNDHTSKPIGDLAAELMLEVSAAIGDPLVLGSNDLMSTATTPRAFGFPAQASLADLEASFGLAQVVGRHNLLAC